MYHETLLKSFILLIFSYIFLWIFYIHIQVMSSAIKGRFFFWQTVCFVFLPSSTILSKNCKINRNCENKHCCLVPIMAKVIQSFTVIYLFEEDSPISSLLRIFIVNGCFIKCFYCIYWDHLAVFYINTMNYVHWLLNVTIKIYIVFWYKSHLGHDVATILYAGFNLPLKKCYVSLYSWGILTCRVFFSWTVFTCGSRGILTSYRMHMESSLSIFWSLGKIGIISFWNIWKNLELQSCHLSPEISSQEGLSYKYDFFHLYRDVRLSVFSCASFGGLVCSELLIIFPSSSFNE